MSKGIHSKEARELAAKHRSNNHFEKLKEQGIHRCPECWETSHRRADFTNAPELGRHRRYKHGILGRSVDAKKMQKLKAEANIRSWYTETEATEEQQRKWERSQIFTIGDEVYDTVQVVYKADES